ncbi:MAG: hypothetical protein EOM34_10845 [Clostridia bacterium]|nr:hypothetical protein [Lachnospiraceae bacterium]NCC01153.1 hypothetical protein [Clostridia bacterium]NCD03051.1 hypothetical protein [Clostridia bacterium]
MANAHNQKEMLYQNLTDAGCSEELTKKCMELFERSDRIQMLKLLREYKAHMLKCIDCLDFLIYRLKKESK